MKTYTFTRVQMVNFIAAALDYARKQPDQIKDTHQFADDFMGIIDAVQPVVDATPKRKVVIQDELVEVESIETPFKFDTSPGAFPPFNLEPRDS